MNDIKIILSLYFALITGIGIYSFFRIRNAADYYISGKKGGLWQVTGSLFATIMGGSAILGTIELSQEAGWAAFWFLFSAAAGLFVLAMITKKVNRLGHYTLPEMILLFYGVKAERTATILIPAAWLGVITVQIIAGAKVLSGLSLMSYRQGTFLCGSVFIFYTLLGGQKSILKTDFVQALTILTGLISLFILKIINTDPESVPPLSANAMFNENFTGTDLFFLLVTYSVTFVVGPDIYSRIFCARNETIARNSVLLTAGLMVPVAFMLTFLGVTAAPGGEATAGNGFILPGTDFLPSWALGLLAASLLAAVMSSADTTLLSSSMILSELVTGNLDKHQSLNITRIFITLTGCVSMFIAVKVASILDVLLLSFSFFSGAFILPVAAGIAGWKVNQHLAYAAMIAGGITALAGKLISRLYPGNTGNLLIIAAFIINGILLLCPFRKSGTAEIIQSNKSHRERGS